MMLEKFDIKKYDEVIARGLCSGVGKSDGQMCIEAAICYALDLPHGDDPGCVTKAVRQYKIELNDARWSSDNARAAGLRDLGIAQLGSLEVVNDIAFSTLLAEKTIRVLIPQLFRDIFTDPELLAVADTCESEGSIQSANAAASAAASASYAAASAATNAATNAASYAATNAARDKYLILSADLCMQCLAELKSPGIELLSKR